MWRCSAVIKTLIFLIFYLHLSSAVTHTLQHVLTKVTSGINFPEFTIVGQVDGQEFEYYDSKIKKAIPKTDWIQKNEGDDYWSGQTQIAEDQQENFKVDMSTLMGRFNQTKGFHTVQKMCGCELDDDGTTRGYYQFGYDGEDFLSLDLKTLTWTAPTPQALITKNKLDQTGTEANDWKNYLENTCINWIKKYLTYGRETLERKERPKASVFEKRSSSPEVVCHATGFFPKAVMITWQKDGEDVHEDVELRETLPNQDGSFQRRSILKVPAEELQKHTYTCVVQHSSLEKELVREVPKGGGSDGESDGGSDGESDGGSDGESDGGSDVAPIVIITAVVAALIALVAVVAGIVVWKKNSGFNFFQPKDYFKGNSSSNNS